MSIPEQPLVSALIALQFVAFGWRINREIQVGDQARKVWLPLPDFINLLSLLCVVAFCVISPLSWGSTKYSHTALSMGYALIASHPISEAAHYRLFSKRGRSVYDDAGRDYPWITDQEAVTVLVSVLVTAIVGIGTLRST